MRFVTILCLLGTASVPLAAIEIATGSMLGPRYDQNAFYVRSSPHSSWNQTYDESPYRNQARGKLMMLRLAQALFDDEWMTEHNFDPQENTRKVIEALDVYKQHGVLAISVSLQGGNPGYSKQVNGIERQNMAALGKGKGLLVSAFHPDGTIKKAWLERASRLIEAANQRGMIICLIYFYQGQDEVLESPRALVEAARNATRWLIQKNYRNVIIDVANEWDIKGDRWSHAGFIPENIDAIVRDVREQFNGADFSLPIGASTGGSMFYPASLARLTDVVMIHGNGRSPQEKIVRLRQLDNYERPVWMTEDDNGRETTRENFAKEAASANELFRRAAGWGYMPWVQAQQFPFDYMPGKSAGFTDDMPVPKRNKAYFKAVLEHIASLVLRKPPETGPSHK